MVIVLASEIFDETYNHFKFFDLKLSKIVIWSSDGRIGLFYLKRMRNK
jgi:hypothetical protein